MQPPCPRQTRYPAQSLVPLIIALLLSALLITPFANAISPLLDIERAVPEVVEPGGVLKNGAGHRLPLAVPGPESREQAQALVTRPLDIPEKNWQPGYRVVDLRAVPGAEVLASFHGTVAFSGVVAGTPVVSIEHPGGIRTTYEPVIAEVKKGQKVTRGQRIGRLANREQLPETARKPHGLSWGARRGDAYFDPFDLLGMVRVRLLA